MNHISIENQKISRILHIREIFAIVEIKLITFRNLNK